MNSRNKEYLDERNNLHGELNKIFTVVVIRGITKNSEIANKLDKTIETAKRHKSDLYKKFLGEREEGEGNSSRTPDFIEYMMENDYNLLHPRLKKQYREEHGDSAFDNQNIGTHLERYFPNRLPLKARIENKNDVTFINHLDENCWSGDSNLYKIIGFEKTEIEAFIQLCEDRGVAKVVKIDFEHSTNDTILGNAGSVMNWYIDELYKQTNSEAEIEQEAIRKQTIDRDPVNGSYEYTQKAIETMESKNEFDSEDNFLLIVVSNIDILFDNNEITKTFYDYLGRVFNNSNFKRIQQIITCSADYFLKINDRLPPFNVGETLTPCGLDLEDIEQLLEANEAALQEGDMETLFNWMDGSLYLWRKAIPYFKLRPFEVEEFKLKTLDNEDFYGFPYRICGYIEQDEELLNSINRLLEPNASLQLGTRAYSVLKKLGVIKRDRNNDELNRWTISCEMYRQIFQTNLPEEAEENSTTVSIILPEEFTVYVRLSSRSDPAPGYDEAALSTFDIENSTLYAKEDIVSIPRDGYAPKPLKTVNEFMGRDGGYIAVYSRDRSKGVYHVGGGIYLIGQIRLEGRYVNGIFKPNGYEHIDISVHPDFIDLCNTHFPSEGGSWAGGETFGWFEGATESE